MSERARRPTDEVTEVAGGDPHALLGAPIPAAAGEPAPLPPPPSLPSLILPPTGHTEPFELDVTEVTPTPGRDLAEWETPTQIDPAPAPPGEPAALAPPRAVPRGAERSEPIRVISMKDQAGDPAPRPEEPRVPLHVQLRSIAEVAGLHDQPADLGKLAPPRDPRKARARRRRANLAWLGVAIALAGLIMLAIWLIAGR
ncbi:MAG TPA: hypothetical protein VFK02_16515 [Kofleriaceae bacterium]|nr:hypothetical protein [Kofleriaceae bacterium]